MNDTLIIDTLKSTIEVATNSKETITINYWFWIAVVEFIIITLYFTHNKKKKLLSKKELFIKNAKESEVDFGNIINSSFNVKPLYDELKTKCHPDRFPNDKIKNKIALELFQDISKNKTNYKKLMEIKEIAINKLNINF